MDVASLELCKELYEFSGWDGASYIHECLPNKSYVTTLSAHSMEHYKDNYYYPAYDLGYLLRKLQVTADWTHGRFDFSHCYDDENGYHWVASYNSYDNNFPIGIASSPEDAACKLAIELFKQGVLVYYLASTDTGSKSSVTNPPKPSSKKSGD